VDSFSCALFFNCGFRYLLLFEFIKIVMAENSKKTKIWSAIISAIVSALTSLSTILFGS
jgi:uncharacterized membrane-anchored protein